MSKKKAQQDERKRLGETVFICSVCGAQLVRNKGGTYHPDFLIRSFKCLGCGRETDMYSTERKKVIL